MIRIEAADLYQSCSWWKDESSLRTIFSKFSSCSKNNNETENHHFSCVEENQVVTTTVTFVSPVDMDDNGNYRVQCLDDSLKDVIIAQLSITVIGETSCYKLG